MVEGISEWIKKWIIREQPRDSYAMAELMRVYLVSEKTRENSATKQTENNQFQRSVNPTRSGGSNHSEWQYNSLPWRHEGKKKRLAERDSGKNVTCYKGGKLGHYATQCPEKALIWWGTIDKGIYAYQCGGMVNSITTNRIHLDTGSTKMSVHSKFVSEAMKTGGFIELWSTNGQKTKYPVARVRIVLHSEEYNREVAVAADLPKNVLLGVDVPWWGISYHD